MTAIKQIGNEFYQSNEEPSFPSLVELHLCYFINLEEWFGDQRSSAEASFSCLEMLEISDCSKLSTTPTIFPSLKRLDFAIKLVDDPNLKSLSLKLLRGANNVLQTLVVRDCNEFVGFLPDNGEEQQHYQPDDTSNNFLSKIEFLSCPSLIVLPAAFSGLNSLTYLAIKDCGSLKSLPDGIQFLPALQTLIIGGFSEDLTSFPFPAATRLEGTSSQYFVSLRELTLCGWPTLIDSLPEQLQLLTSLHRLNIRDFSSLLSLPEWFGELSSLRIFDIENCRKLEYLPSEEQMLRLTSLQIFSIRCSPLLLERCCFPNEEWHKIAHLKQVSRSSLSLLDHITREADMNENIEARRRSGVFSNKKKEKCWIDSSGRNSFMLFPRSLGITWEHDTRYWTWLSITEPSARYQDSYGWDTPVDLCLLLPDGQRLVQKVNLETLPKSQWIEIHVGDFVTPHQPCDQQKEVNFIMSEHEKLNWKKGLVIKGAIVRPKK
ncbi:hypothetical protein MKX03_037243 [Papaver bracteatum]|nr:hypothetical protein MKX03_037243 [Papaver bracteatum]